MTDLYWLRRMLDDFRSATDVTEQYRDLLRHTEYLEPFKEMRQLTEQIVRESQALASPPDELVSRSDLAARGALVGELAAGSHSDQWLEILRDREWLGLGGRLRDDSSFLNSALQALDELKETTRPTGDVLSQLDRAAVSFSPIVAMLGGAAREGLLAGSLPPGLAVGFGHELLGMMVRAGQIEEEDELADFLGLFLSWLLQQTKRLGGLILTPAVIWNIFFAVLQILVSQVLSDSANERLMEEVRSAREEIKAELRAQVACVPVEGVPASPAHRVLIEETVLRKDPRHDAGHLRLLAANSLVQEVKQNNGWSLVQFFDYVEGGFSEGWVESGVLEVLEISADSDAEADRDD